MKGTYEYIAYLTAKRQIERERGRENFPTIIKEQKINYSSCADIFDRETTANLRSGKILE